MRRLLLLLVLAVPRACPDGGVIEFRADSGPYTVTLFNSSAPLRAGPADLSVLVEDRVTNAPVMEAQVSLRLSHPRAKPFAVAATHARATNKLLYAATVPFDEPGRWQVALEVKQDERIASVTHSLQVLPAPPAAVVFWPYLVLPFLLVVLFVCNQRLKRSQYGRSPTTFPGGS